MVLYKLDEYYPDCQDDMFGGHDIKSFNVYAGDNDKVGSVKNILIDEMVIDSAILLWIQASGSLARMCYFL